MWEIQILKENKNLIKIMNNDDPYKTVFSSFSKPTRIFYFFWNSWVKYACYCFKIINLSFTDYKFYAPCWVEKLTKKLLCPWTWLKAREQSLPRPERARIKGPKGPEILVDSTKGWEIFIFFLFLSVQPEMKSISLMSMTWMKEWCDWQEDR